MRVNPFNVQLNNSQKLRPCGPKQNDIAFGRSYTAAKPLVDELITGARRSGYPANNMLARIKRETDPADLKKIVEKLPDETGNVAVIVSALKRMCGISQ